MQPLTVAAIALGLGATAVVFAPKDGLKFRLPKLKHRSPVSGLTTLPSPAELAPIVAVARFRTPLDGEDNNGGGWKDPVSQSPWTTKGIEVAEQLAHGGRGAREELFRALLEAIEVGLYRPVSKSAPGAEEPGEIVLFALAYMMSPQRGSLRQRVAFLHDATNRLIWHPTIQQYVDGRWFGQSWLAAGGGVSAATGKPHKKEGSEALWPGLPVALYSWQTVKKIRLQELIGDWQTLFGKPGLTIDTATTTELANLAVALGAFYVRTASEKTSNWPLGAPSKVDTWGSVLKVLGAAFSAVVASFSGNYAAVVGVALKAAGKAPLPVKAQNAINEGIAELQSWV